MSRRERQKSRPGGSGEAPKARGKERRDLQFTVWTGVYGAAGLLTSILGFFLLAQGSINLAPVLLLIGFLVFFPLALVK